MVKKVIVTEDDCNCGKRIKISHTKLKYFKRKIKNGDIV